MQKIITNLFFFFLYVCSPIFVCAQYSVKGSVTEKQTGMPLEFATVAVYRTDSTLLNGTVTDKDGAFLFREVKAGKYILEVRLMGYRTLHRDIDVEADLHLDTVELQETSVAIGEVTVKASAPPVIQKPDRMVVNVDAYTLTAGKNASEILKSLPGVILESDKTLSVIGKKAVVFIDGKPADLTGTSTDKILETLQGERIERVELITNPSSRYDAEYSGAIIDIHLKKDESLGYNGTASMTMGIKESGLVYMPSVNANFRTEKLNVYGSYGLHHGKYKQRFGDLKRYHHANVPIEYDENSIYKPNGTSQNGTLGIDWFPSSQHTLGLLTRGGIYDGGNVNHSTTYIRRIGASETDSSIVSPIHMNINSKSYSFDINHKWTIGKDRSLTTDAVYSYADHEQEQKMTLNYFDAGGQVLRPQNGNGHRVFQKTDVWMLKTDFESRIIHEILLETGGQISRIKRDNDMTGLTLKTADTWDENKTQSNHFFYKEQIAALYVNFSKQWKHLDISLGLRGEHTYQHGAQAANDSSFTIRYFDLFPSASLQYSFGRNQSLSLSYAYKINRPSFSMLNPFRFYTSPNTFMSGNPNLMPSYRHNLQLNYRLHRYNLTLSYIRINGLFIKEPAQDDDSRKQSFIYANFGKADIYSASLNIPVNMTKWWTLNLSGNGFYREYHSLFMGNDFHKTYFNGNIRMNNRFDIGKGWRMQLNGSLISSTWNIARKIEMRGNMNISVEKTLFGGKGNLSASLADPFRWQKTYSSLRYNNIDTESYAFSDSRFFQIGFTYRFGSEKVQQSRKRQTGIESIEKRL